MGTGLGDAQVNNGTVGGSGGVRRPRSERVDELAHVVGKLAGTVGGGQALDQLLASAYAGWAGSLPAGVAEQRLDQALVLADLPPAEFVRVLLPTMFSEGTPAESVEAFRASMLAFDPVGFRSMARASARTCADILPQITIATLLVDGDSDVRAR